MGFFKQLKDSKALISAAPGMINQTNQLAAAAQQAQQAQYAAMQSTMTIPSARPAADQMDAIAGVDLPTYAWIAKQIAYHGYDQSLLPGFAAECGVSAQDWDTAMHGWAARMNDPAIAREFRSHYDGF